MNKPKSKTRRYSKSMEKEFEEWKTQYEEKTGCKILVDGKPATAKTYFERATKIENRLLKEQKEEKAIYKKEEFLDIVQKSIDYKNSVGRKLVNPDGTIATATDIATRLANALNSEDAQNARAKFIKDKDEIR